MMQIQISINGVLIELINVVNETSGKINENSICNYSVKAVISGKFSMIEHNRSDGAVELTRKALNKIII